MLISPKPEENTNRRNAHTNTRQPFAFRSEPQTNGRRHILLGASGSLHSACHLLHEAGRRQHGASGSLPVAGIPAKERQAHNWERSTHFMKQTPRFIKRAAHSKRKIARSLERVISAEESAIHSSEEIIYSHEESDLQNNRHRGTKGTQRTNGASSLRSFLSLPSLPAPATALVVGQASCPSEWGGLPACPTDAALRKTNAPHLHTAKSPIVRPTYTH